MNWYGIRIIGKIYRTEKYTFNNIKDFKAAVKVLILRGDYLEIMINRDLKFGNNEEIDISWLENLRSNITIVNITYMNYNKAIKEGA